MQTAPHLRRATPDSHRALITTSPMKVAVERDKSPCYVDNIPAITYDSVGAIYVRSDSSSIPVMRHCSRFISRALLWLATLSLPFGNLAATTCGCDARQFQAAAGARAAGVPRRTCCGAVGFSCCCAKPRGGSAACGQQPRVCRCGDGHSQSPATPPANSSATGKLLCAVLHALSGVSSSTALQQADTHAASATLPLPATPQETCSVLCRFLI